MKNFSLKSKIMYTVLIVSVALSIMFSYFYFGSQYFSPKLTKVSSEQMELLGSISSKRDYCNLIGLITSKESELFKSTISKLYYVSKTGENLKIGSDKYYEYVDRGLQMYNDDINKNDVVQHEMLKHFCSELEEQAINLVKLYK